MRTLTKITTGVAGTALACACLLGAGPSACGSAGEAPASLPPSGRAYRALDAAQRLEVAKTCRAHAAAATAGIAARQIAAIDPEALRDQLDGDYLTIAEQRRPVAAVCAKVVPFVTPGLRIRFDGVKRSGDTFTFETSSDKPLTMRGIGEVPGAGKGSGRVAR